MPPSESATPSAPSLRTGLFPFALAVVDTLVAWRLNAIWLGETAGLPVVVIAVLFGLSSIVAAYRRPTLAHWRIVLLMLGGMVVGVILDVVVDGILTSADRTMFPMEIAFLWIVSIVPIALGIFLGRALHRSRILDTHE